MIKPKLITSGGNALRKTLNSFIHRILKKSFTANKVNILNIHSLVYISDEFM